MSIEVETDDMDRVYARVSTRFKQARKETLDAGVAYAVQHCPVSEGPPSGGILHLYETIRVVGVNQYSSDLVAGDPSKNVDYAPPNEYGTYKMAARPYMRPAAKHMVMVLRQKLSKVIG